MGIPLSASCVAPHPACLSCMDWAPPLSCNSRSQRAPPLPPQRCASSACPPARRSLVTPLTTPTCAWPRHPATTPPPHARGTRRTPRGGSGTTPRYRRGRSGPEAALVRASGAGECMHLLPLKLMCARTRIPPGQSREHSPHLPPSALQVLGGEGPAPASCTPEIMRAIAQQHVDSPAVLAIFPIQVC